MVGDESKIARYRRLAADARAAAQKATMPQARQMMFDVAYSYERLANTLEANDARRAGDMNSPERESKSG